MRDSFQLRSLITALALGVVWWFVVAYALAYSAYISVPLIHMFRSLGASVDHIHTLIRLTDLVVWAALFGALFGLPLGFIVRSRVSIYWLIFVGTALLASIPIMRDPAAKNLASVGAWSIPETWGYFFGVLCFARWASSVSSKQGRANVVP